MDCFWALIYPLRGRRWFIWLPALACVAWIPLIGQIIGLIYSFEVIRRVAQGDPIPPGFNTGLRDTLASRSLKAKRSEETQPVNGPIKRGTWVILSLVVHVIILSQIFSVLDTTLRSPRPQNNDLLSLAEGLFGVFVMLHFLVGAVRYLVSDEKRALWQVSTNAQILWRRWPLIGWALLNIVFYFGLLCGPCFIPITIVSANLDRYPWYIPPADRTPMYYILIVLAFALFFLWFAMVPHGIGYILGQMAHHLDLSADGEKRKNSTSFD